MEEDYGANCFGCKCASGTKNSKSAIGRRNLDPATTAAPATKSSANGSGSGSKVCSAIFAENDTCDYYVKKFGVTCLELERMGIDCFGCKCQNDKRTKPTIPVHSPYNAYNYGYPAPKRISKQKQISNAYAYAYYTYKQHHQPGHGYGYQYGYGTNITSATTVSTTTSTSTSTSTSTTSTSTTTSTTTSTSTSTSTTTPTTLKIRFGIPKEDCEDILKSPKDRKQLLLQIAQQIADMRAQFGSFSNATLIYETIKDSQLTCGSLFINLNLGGAAGQIPNLDDQLVDHIAKNGLTVTIGGKTFEACACANGGTIDPTTTECRCNCDTGYTGARCLEKFECPQNCAPYGILKGSVADRDCSCKCTAGYDSVYCKPGPLPCPDVCLNGGIKVGTVAGKDCGCSCPNDFTGKRCEWDFPCPDWTIFNGTTKNCDIQTCAKLKDEGSNCNVDRPEGDTTDPKCGGCCPNPSECNNGGKVYIVGTECRCRPEDPSQCMWKVGPGKDPKCPATEPVLDEKNCGCYPDCQCAAGYQPVGVVNNKTCKCIPIPTTTTTTTISTISTIG